MRKRIKSIPVGFIAGMLVLLGLLAASWAGCSSRAGRREALVVPQSKEEAIAELKKLGGSVEVDDKSPDRPVVRVSLHAARISDPDLRLLTGFTKLQTLSICGPYCGRARISDAGLVHLKGLTSLQTLDLGVTRVSNAGLVHLKGLTSLQTLDLSSTLVSDKGLENLKGLSNLEHLDLSNIEISDAGLVHLIGLSRLTDLDLQGTEVSDEGISKLKEALPNCKIRFP